MRKGIFTSVGIILALSFCINNTAYSDDTASTDLEKTDYVSQFPINNPAKVTFKYENGRFVPVVNGTTGKDIVTFTFQKEYGNKNTADSVKNFVWNIDTDNTRNLMQNDTAQNPDIIYYINNSRLAADRIVTQDSSFVANSIDNDFVGNNYIAKPYGGAILHNNKGLVLESITGDFVNNTITNPTIGSGSSDGGVNGGLIYNTSTINNIKANFINNIVISDSTKPSIAGNAIANFSGGVIGKIEGNFIGNKGISKDFAYGGAIAQNNSIIGDSSLKDKEVGSNFETTDVISGDFIQNTLEASTYAEGGAIHNDGYIMGNIKGSYVENGLKASSGNAFGGAIFSKLNYNDTDRGRIYGDITGDFIGNYAKASGNASGGAIYTSSIIDGNITGDFKGNYVEGNETYGGALYLSGSNKNAGVHGNIKGNFSQNYAQASSGSAIGGAIYLASKIKNNLIANFNKNRVESLDSQVNGGALALHSGGRIEGSIKGEYTDNSAITTSTDSNAQGGAISNLGSIGYSENGEVQGKIEANFSNNIAKSDSQRTNATTASGGALHNASSGKISAIEGNFTNNTVQGRQTGGGAIYNSGTIGQADSQTPAIVGKFTSNKAVATSVNYYYGGGGAVFNSDGSIHGIKADFEDNSISTETGSARGGAIYDFVQRGKSISSIIGKFKGNKAIATGNNGNAQGGAVGQFVDGHVEDAVTVISDSTFEENKTEAKNNSQGGAVFVESDIVKGGKIKISSSEFNNNSAISEKNAQGGAIYTNNKVTIEIDNSNFSGNTAISKADTNTGGVVGGGAIYNDGGVTTVKDSNFENNKAVGMNAQGGAIYNKNYVTSTKTVKGVVNIIAQVKDVLFKGNTTAQSIDSQSVSNAVYNNGGTINLNASADKKIKFDDNIVSTDDSVININKEGDWDTTTDRVMEANTTLSGIPLDTPVGGTIVMNADMTKITGNVNLYGGTVEFGENSKFFNQAKVSVEGLSKISVINNIIEEINFKELVLNEDLKIGLDANLATGEADKLSADSITVLDGKGIIISDISFIADNGSNKINIASESLRDYITLAENADFNITGANESYNVSYDKTSGDMSFIGVDSLTASMQMAKDGDRYVMTKDETINIPLGTANADNYGVNGGGNSITGNGVSGFEVTGDKYLNLSNIKNVQGFVSENGGAVNNGGVLHIMDTSFKNNTADKTGGAIYNAGTTTITADKADVVFEGNKDSSGSNAIDNNGLIVLGSKNKNIIMNDTVTNKGTLSLNAQSGNIVFNKEIKGTDNTTDIITIQQTTPAKGEVQFNNTVSNHTIKQTSGTTTFLANGNFDNTVNYNISGGTISLQSNSINTANLGNVTLGGDVNLKLDADLNREKIDQITVDSLKAEGYNINVNDIIILEPTTKEELSLSPVENIADDTLKQSLASAMRYTGSDLTYSPIFKYRAKYNPDDGNFTFTRLATNPSRPSYNDLNPAIMATPVASQVGGYLTQLNNYKNAFNFIDTKMMMPKYLRQLASMENHYAINDDEIPYKLNAIKERDKVKPHKLNAVKISDEGWFRPYTTIENVNLKNGPKVSNVMYGTYFGANGKVKRLKNGKELQNSILLGYNGSRQSYGGNSIIQNGGSLGLTTALYKGNAFGALTASAGANVASASTNFGSDTFPLLMAGVAGKTGYNIELMDGRFIIQPNVVVSYSFVNTFGDQTYGATKISSDPLHAIQFTPGVKFIANVKESWQPYFATTVRCNFMDKTKFEVQDVMLPELSVKPYVELSAGLQKMMVDRIGGFFQTIVRMGGRTGVALSAGINILLGKSESL